MLRIALTPPGLYVTTAVIIVLATLIYWKRKPIKKWLRGLRVKEIKVGPVTLEHKKRAKQQKEPKPTKPRRATPPRGVERNVMFWSRIRASVRGWVARNWMFGSEIEQTEAGRSAGEEEEDRK
jgi:hypothetical protein